eukprot:GFUD01001740.1.p1 GENE.GFUD01001740.1~~GFUD01001740.1.p1  ORF type:complete len:323 (+),score=95.76 GFUD01001740.1:81-1049(+)
MSRLSRIITEDFDRFISSVGMDERFVVIGQENGSVCAIYHKNGAKVFSAKISDDKITAVCCEEQDEDDNPIFYAADNAGKVFTINRKGKIIAHVQIPARKGKIHTIVNRSKFSIYVYTDTGSTSFTNCTKTYQKGKFSSTSANFSVSRDGTLQKKPGGGGGDFKINQYDCKTPTNAVATWGIEFGKKIKNFTQVLAFGVFDDKYSNLIEEGAADTTLTVCSKDIFRTLEFAAPVKQVMSCRHHEGEAAADKIFILLCDGNIFKVTGMLLEDPSVSNEALDLEPVLASEDEEDAAKGEFHGFCVYGKNICVFGDDGLFAVDGE